MHELERIGQYPVNNIPLIAQLTWALSTLGLVLGGPGLVGYILIFKDGLLGWPVCILAGVLAVLGLLSISMLLQPHKRHDPVGPVTLETTGLPQPLPLSRVPIRAGKPNKKP